MSCRNQTSGKTTNRMRRTTDGQCPATRSWFSLLKRKRKTTDGQPVRPATRSSLALLVLSAPASAASCSWHMYGPHRLCWFTMYSYASRVLEFSVSAQPQTLFPIYLCHGYPMEDDRVRTDQRKEQLQRRWDRGAGGGYRPTRSSALSPCPFFALCWALIFACLFVLCSAFRGVGTVGRRPDGV